MKAVRLVIPSNGVPALQMRLVESRSTSGKEKEGTRYYIVIDLAPWFKVHYLESILRDVTTIPLWE